MDIFDKTSAEKKSIGFSYQDYVALKHALELKPEESIGIEVFDDLHLENINGQKTFIQVKHSIKNSNNITNKDIDLWKTLYNWSEAIKIINDKDISLVFYTNKGLTLESGIVKLLSSNTKEINKINNEIKEILQAHKNHGDDIYKYIYSISNLPDNVSERLFRSISFQHSEDEIILQIKMLLKTFSIPDDKIDDVFHNISGAFFEYKYKQVKKDSKVIINYEYFRNTLAVDRIIQISRNCINNFDQYYDFESAYPTDIDSKISYKQLQDLDLNIDAIIKYINEMAKTDAFIQKLKSSGDLTTQEEKLIYKKAFDEWQSRHLIAYMRSRYSEINEAHLSIAFYVYSELTGNCDIILENNKLPRSMTTGAFLLLSDKPTIGWLQNWESIYK
ncbi:hypothetical protein [Brenneria izbisi]|uniref:CD-NTase associated protein 4-like DNA endonuclease domain-containing protein n=1 Tax=Brenneria izbisi TaxID=2939450 RepID=A0AA41XY07_9GAMM|nr:hypothetical protein [Brenneria izbisi]MCV9879493.1 hypothetical protein [Brenneria izbisi]MCV9882882.1 hypothetical protein [Brenneria izbisi]